jgi:hypothetical protein
LNEAARSLPEARANNKHMIPAHLARAARMRRPPADFDED